MVSAVPIRSTVDLLPHIDELERCDADDERTIRRCVRDRKPVVITGLKFWSDGALTPDWLCERYGHMRLAELRVGYGGGYNPADEEASRTLADYLEKCRRQEAALTARDADSESGAIDKRYVANIELDEFPEVDARFIHNSLGPDCVRLAHILTGLGRRTHKEIFVGAPHAGIPLHFDRYQLTVVNYQLYGSKQWTLFPPTESGFLYPELYYPHVSAIVDPSTADLTQFPLYAKARGISTVLRAGECLLTPPSWWHATRSITTTISVSVRVLRPRDLAAFLGLVMLVKSIDWNARLLRKCVEASQRRRR
jgi:hypothetical protein